MRCITPTGCNQTARADDWVRTSILRLTRSAPFSVEPRRQPGRKRPEGVQGDSHPPPRPSQGRMLANYTTDTINRTVAGAGFEPALFQRIALPVELPVAVGTQDGASSNFIKDSLLPKVLGYHLSHTPLLAARVVMMKIKASGVILSAS